MKCHKKLVKVVGIFCVNLYTGHGQYPSLHMVWLGGCHIEHPKDDLTKAGKDLGGYWEGLL